MESVFSFTTKCHAPGFELLLSTYFDIQKPEHFLGKDIEVTPSLQNVEIKISMIYSGIFRDGQAALNMSSPACADHLPPYDQSKT